MDFKYFNLVFKSKCQYNNGDYLEAFKTLLDLNNNSIIISIYNHCNFKKLINNLLNNFTCSDSYFEFIDSLLENKNYDCAFTMLFSLKNENYFLYFYNKYNFDKEVLFFVLYNDNINFKNKFCIFKKFFVDYNMNINVVDDDNRSLLMITLIKKINFWYELCKLFLYYNIDLNLKDNFGKIAYDYASELNYYFAMELLYKFNASF